VHGIMVGDRVACVAGPDTAYAEQRIIPAARAIVLPAAIDDYDRRRNARHAIPKDQQRANKEFGEAAFYGWSEDKARQAAKAEGAAFPPYLRAHGFTLD